MTREHEAELKYTIIATLLQNAQFSKEDGVGKLIETAKTIFDFVIHYRAQPDTDTKEDSASLTV